MTGKRRPWQNAFHESAASVPRPLVLDANREYWVEGPGVLDAAVAGPTGAVMYLRKCVFLNRTKESLSINGVRYFLGGHVYLNFTGLDEPGFADWQRESQFLVRTGGNVANEIRYKGPEEVNKLLRQESWNRMYPNRNPELEPGRRGGGSRRRNVPDGERFCLPSSRDCDMIPVGNTSKEQRYV